MYKFIDLLNILIAMLLYVMYLLLISLMKSVIGVIFHVIGVSIWYLNDRLETTQNIEYNPNWKSESVCIPINDNIEQMDSTEFCLYYYQRKY